MDTPIYDFIRRYSAENFTRLHMPGHKGENIFGCENFDITEIDGADNLYSPEDDGIIKKSEANASKLYETKATFYSTGGSSQCIFAMLYLAKIAAKKKPSEDVVLVARNAHKTFVSACALLDINPMWMYPSDDATSGICSCVITKTDLETKLANMSNMPIAVFITSPDYLGNIADIKGLSEVCGRYDVPLLIDNAHGAYLKFLQNDIHPITLGASMSCDSAHKTLPVLTGGAYLHINKNSPASYKDSAKVALSLFGSTSPSYLTLTSLDLCNKILSEDFPKNLNRHVKSINALKATLYDNDIKYLDGEPLKLTLLCSEMSVSPQKIAHILRKNKIEIEFADNDFLVCMFTAQISDEELADFASLLLNIFSKRENIASTPLESIAIPTAIQAMSIREAIFSPQQKIKADNAAIGKICASLAVSCPPAIPIAVSGEIIQSEHIKLFNHYDINEIFVVSE